MINTKGTFGKSELITYKINSQHDTAWQRHHNKIKEVQYEGTYSETTAFFCLNHALQTTFCRLRMLTLCYRIQKQ